MKNILFLESFYGGSHKSFADTIIDKSKYNIDLLTMPARHWKLRHAGSAFKFSEIISNRKINLEKYDLIFTTSLIDLSLLKDLNNKLPPIVHYFHETQFHYPLSDGEVYDIHYGLGDLRNLISADKALFNSSYHLETFFKEAELKLRKLPDFIPVNLLNNLKNKCTVLYPPINCTINSSRKKNKTTIILWNHRWEHDKNPKLFLDFLNKLQNDDIQFKLLLLGERYKKTPDVFTTIINNFKKHIISDNYCKTYDDYLSYLDISDYVISSSNQENYGISVIEAVSRGAIPLLPNRLSYPEILADQFHNKLLYSDLDDLVVKFKKLLISDNENLVEQLTNSMKKYQAKDVLNNLDIIFQDLS